MRAKLRRADTIPIVGRLARSVAFVEELHPERLLDIGCRAGWLEGAAEVPCIVGIDLERPDEAARVEPKVAQASALALPFPDESFDVVAMFEVLEHVPKDTESAALGEVRRVLRPGGSLVLSTPNWYPAGTLLDPAWWLQGHRHYREPELMRLFQQARLDVTHREITGDITEAVYLPIFYVFRRLGIRIPYESRWEARVDREYHAPGRQTHFVVARRPWRAEGSTR